MTTPLPMTAGRIVALIIGVPLALAIIGWTGLTWVAYAGQSSYPVRLDIPVHGGTVSVSAGPANMSVSQEAGGRLRLSGTARYSLVRSTVTWHRSSSGLAVFSHCHFLVSGVCSFDYRLTLPAGLPAVISDGSGDLTLQTLAGHIKATAGSGNIDASGLSGTVDLQTGSGDISGTTLSGPKEVLGTGSGNITLTGLTSADVTASAGSGDISLTFTKIPGYVQVTGHSGNVTLVLPRGVAYRVAASTASGNNSVTASHDLSSTHIIIVSTQSGDISVRN